MFCISCRLPFTKTRQLILTNQPRLIYVDAETLVVKGVLRCFAQHIMLVALTACAIAFLQCWQTIPWTETLWAEVKSDKVFYIHTVSYAFILQPVMVIIINTVPIS